MDRHGTTLELIPDTAKPGDFARSGTGLLPLLGIGVAMTVHQDHSSSPRASLNGLVRGDVVIPYARENIGNDGIGDGLFCWWSRYIEFSANVESLLQRALDVL